MRMKVLGISLSTRAALALAGVLMVIGCGWVSLSLLMSVVTPATLYGTPAPQGNFGENNFSQSLSSYNDSRVIPWLSSGLSPREIELRLNQYQRENPALASTALNLYELQVSANSQNTATAIQREFTRAASTSTPLPGQVSTIRGGGGGGGGSNDVAPTQPAPVDLAGTQAALEVNATRFAVEANATFAALSALATQQALAWQQIQLSGTQTAAAAPLNAAGGEVSRRDDAAQSPSGGGGTAVANAAPMNENAGINGQSVLSNSPSGTFDMSSTLNFVDIVVNGVGIFVGVIGAVIGYRALQLEAENRRQLAQPTTAPQIVESTARAVIEEPPPPPPEDTTGSAG